MIFAFAEDGALDIVENLSEAQRRYEGLDVESGVYVFYDDRGVYLRPHFTVPNKHGNILGLFGWRISGIFELTPHPQGQNDPLWLALYETQNLSPNKYFRTLEGVKAYLKSKGAIVDRPE